jgi:hypothetical protein
MEDMGQDDFYEDDEPVEDVQAAWRQGEGGHTKGPRDLNQRAKSIVDQAVSRLETAETAETAETMLVDATGWFGANVRREVASTNATTRDESLAHA